MGTDTAVKAEAAALEAKTGLRFADYSPYGCVPGTTCKCPTRFARCRMWDLFEKAARQAAGEPEPKKPRIINKYGQDVTGRIYPSKSAAMNDLYGSLCE